MILTNRQADKWHLDRQIEEGQANSQPVKVMPLKATVICCYCNEVRSFDRTAAKITVKCAERNGGKVQ